MFVSNAVEGMLRPNKHVTNMVENESKCVRSTAEKFNLSGT